MTKTLPFVLFLLSSVCINAQNFSDWKLVYEKDGAVFTKCDFLNDQYGIAIGKGGLIMVTEDGGENWTDRSDATLGDLVSIDVVDEDLILLTNKHQVFRSTDKAINWTKTFDRSDVNIVSIEKLLANNSDKPTFLSCEKGRLFISHSDGVKWFEKDISNLIGSDNNILYCYGGKVASLSDSFYSTFTSKMGFVYTEDDFGSIDYQNDPLQNVDVNRHVDQYDFSEPWFGYDAIYIGANNELWKEGHSRPLIDASSQVLNGCIFIRQMLGGDYWFGWAVGDGGYISESYSESFGKYKQITSPTTKDLNWIDWAGNKVTSQVGFSRATVCAVGDGVILQKRLDWGPVAMSGIDFDISTEVYPNPFQNEFNLLCSGWESNEEVVVRLYNLNGVLIKELFKGKLSDGSLQLQVNEALEQGVYLLEMSSAGKREVKRLIKA